MKPLKSNNIHLGRMEDDVLPNIGMKEATAKQIADPKIVLRKIVKK